MNKKSVLKTIATLTLMTIFGCGGGGGKGGGIATLPPVEPGVTSISGVVAKGPVSGADITVYPVLSDGTVDTSNTLGTTKTTTDGTGRYQVTLSSAPVGPVVVQATGGTYTDEASKIAGVRLTTKLRAVVTGLNSGIDNKISVTPLTELAFNKAEGSGRFTEASIKDANSAIQTVFAVDNIITALPFDITGPEPSYRTVTAAEKQYSAVLGVISQMAMDATVNTAAAPRTNETMSTATNTVITSIANDVSTTGGMQSASLVSYNSALATFKGNGLIPATTTPPPVIKFTGGVLTISTEGNLGTANGVAKVINGIDLTITLPDGITIDGSKVDAQGKILEGILLPSGKAAGSASIEAIYTAKNGAAPGTVQIIFVKLNPGFAVGEFLHLNFLGDPSNISVFPDMLLNGIEGGVEGAKNTEDLLPTGVTLTNKFVGL